MTRIGTKGRHKKRATFGLAALVAAAGIAVGAIALNGGNDEASAAESCQGLDTALQNNLNFIAGQQANPDAQSEARIANREAVVAQIQQRREVAGCTGEVVAQPINTGGAGGSGESCEGLDTALQNNLNFIAGQQANPDAQSEARIANREAVVAQIQQRREVAGCTGEVVAQPIDTGGAGSAGESCEGLDTALRNNLNFIAAQQANPDAQSAARIENRQAVVDLIEQRRDAAGCTAVIEAG